jgi:hypothetical protein
MQNSLIMNMNNHFELPESCALEVVTAGFARFASGDRNQAISPHRLVTKQFCFAAAPQRRHAALQLCSNDTPLLSVTSTATSTKSVKDVFGQSVKDVGLHMKSGVNKMLSHAGQGGLD